MKKRDVIDLTGDDDDEVTTAETAVKRKKTNEPTWLSKRGVSRIFSEMRSLSRDWENETPKLFDVDTVSNNALCWRFKVNGFDESGGGKQLNDDLDVLENRRGQGYILMEIEFPADYPTRPFFLRIVSPRMRWYTGHVTAGGSICVEALTTSNTPNSWNHKTHCVESILRTVFANMVFAEEGFVRTANGGGRTGPLRIDLYRHFSHDVLIEYSTFEARSAFTRMLDHHRRNGW